MVTVQTTMESVGTYTYQVQPSGFLAENGSITGGVNIRPLDAVVLKVEYLYSVPKQELLGNDDPIQLFQAQAAWAF